MDNNEKMTLEEYQKKYSKPVNTKSAKIFLFIFAASIGVVVFFCLFQITTKIYDMNKIAGYIAIGVSVIIFILIYLLPLFKLSKTKAFITNVSKKNAKEAQKYNQALRESLADKMIDLHAKTNNVSWYSEEKIGKLALARHLKNNKETKKVLTDIYKTDVNKAANKMIRDHALKVGIATAISQSEKVDTLFVVAYDLNLIKDIIFLYGFRPSDAELAKIYRNVLADALVSYGLNSLTSNLGTTVATKISSMGKGMPIVGGVIGTVVDSVTQGIINSSLTVIIGTQTKKYLMKEYRLQDILDEVIITDEEEEKEAEEMISSLKDDIKNAKKGKNDLQTC